MTPAWSDEDLVCLARDYRNHPDVYDLIEGVRRVLALCEQARVAYVDGVCCDYCWPPIVLAALNDPPNGATP